MCTHIYKLIEIKFILQFVKTINWDMSNGQIK